MLPIPAKAASSSLRWVEGILTGCLVLLKLHVLYKAWGHMEGFDADPWLDVFHATHWFKPLLPLKSLFNAYHPPLSFLVARVLYRVYPHEVEVSQILSTAALVGATFALRHTLRTVGVLWTVPGLVMLYVTASLPLFVWLAIETSYEGFVFMLFMLALALSAHCFWAPWPAEWWKEPKCGFKVVAIGVVLAAGLFAKFTGLFALMLPVVILWARRDRASLRDGAGALAAVALAIAIAGPFYYGRYYRPLHVFFPSNMEWLRADDLKAAVTRRDADRWHFLLHLLRVPTESITASTMAVRDSFFHSVWFQLWKRDADALGSGRAQGPASFAISNFYVKAFPVFLIASGAILCFQRSRLPAPWRRLGLIAFLTTTPYVLGVLCYGWKYPLWDWGPLKAKYAMPGVLWIGYCAALPLVPRSTTLVPSWAGRIGATAALLVAVVFMFVNHLVPVY